MRSKMWNVYPLIKSEGVNPVILESSLDRALRESEENSQRFAEEQLNKIPNELRELEAGLVQLNETNDEGKLWEIANNIDENSRMVTFYAIFGLPSLKVKEYYGKVIQTLKKTSEVLGEYSSLDLFSRFSEERGDYLIRLASKHRLEVN